MSFQDSGESNIFLLTLTVYVLSNFVRYVISLQSLWTVHNCSYSFLTISQIFTSKITEWAYGVVNYLNPTKKLIKPLSTFLENQILKEKRNRQNFTLHNIYPCVRTYCEERIWVRFWFLDLKEWFKNNSLLSRLHEQLL